MHALIVSTTFTCLAGVFVAIRLWTRLGLIKTPGYDDLLIVLALVCGLYSCEDLSNGDPRYHLAYFTPSFLSV